MGPLSRGGPIFSRIGLPEEAQYGPVLPLGGIRTRIAPAKDSGSGALGNTLSLEGNIATAIFHYSIVWKLRMKKICYKNITFSRLSRLYHQTRPDQTVSLAVFELEWNLTSPINPSSQAVPPISSAFSAGLANYNHRACDGWRRAAYFRATPRSVCLIWCKFLLRFVANSFPDLLGGTADLLAGIGAKAATELAGLESSLVRVAANRIARNCKPSNPGSRLQVKGPKYL